MWSVRPVSRWLRLPTGSNTNPIAGESFLHYQPGVSSDFMAVYAGEELLAAIFSPGLDAAQVAVKSELLLEGFDRVRNLPGGEKAGAKKPAGSAKAAGTDGELEKLLGTPET